MNFTATLPRFALHRRSTQPSRPQPAAGSTPAATLAPQAPQARLLQRHATLRLQNSALALRVLSGCVWITRDGCAADWVLDAGQVFEQRPGAPVLVHALQDAELELVAAGAGSQNA